MPEVRSNPKQDYIARLFGQESKDLKNAREALAKDKKEGINVSSSEGALLKFFIQAFGLKNVLEIGTLYAYSTLWMAEALPEDGQITSLEKSPENYEKAKSLVSDSKSVNKINLLQGDATELLKEVSFTPDLVFIDADKQSYGDYLTWALENVAVGGLIIGDNTFLFGNVTGEAVTDYKPQETIQVMREFNERLAKAKNFASIIIPTMEGMTVGRRLR